MARPRKENPKVRIQISLESEQIKGIENTLEKLKNVFREYGAEESELEKMNRSWLIREMLDVIASEAGFQMMAGAIRLVAPQKI